MGRESTVLDNKVVPLAVAPSAIANHPYFDRKLRFTSAVDSTGRIRLAAFTVHNCQGSGG